MRQTLLIVLRRSTFPTYLSERGNVSLDSKILQILIDWHYFLQTLPTLQIRLISCFNRSYRFDWFCTCATQKTANVHTTHKGKTTVQMGRARSARPIGTVVRAREARAPLCVWCPKSALGSLCIVYLNNMFVYCIYFYTQCLDVDSKIWFLGQIWLKNMILGSNLAQKYDLFVGQFWLKNMICGSILAQKYDFGVKFGSKIWFRGQF